MSACHTGSEAGIQSPPWPSVENAGMQMSVYRNSNEVDFSSATWQHGSNHAAKSCDDEVCMQIGATREEANVDLSSRLASLGINRQSSIGLAHPQSDIDFDNGKQHRSLAELSFRIDFPGDVNGLLSSVDAFEMIESSNMLFGKDTGWNNFASEGEVELQCENQMSSKHNSHAESHTLVRHVDEGYNKMWRGGPLSSKLDTRTLSHNSRESGSPVSVNADYSNLKPMKVGGIELRKLPWKDSEHLSSSKQATNEPNNFLLLERESQCQALSSRRKYDSDNASSRAEKYRVQIESSIGHLRVPPLQYRALQSEAQVQDEDLYIKQGMQAEALVQDEDLYIKQGMLPSIQHNYHTSFTLPARHKAPQSKEEELCPVSTFMMVDDPSPQLHGYAGNSLAFQGDVEAYRAALSRAMKESLSNPISSSQPGSTKANRLQIHDIGADRNLMHQSEFSSQYFAGPHDRLHGFHSNKQFPVDPYCPRLPSSNRAYALPMDWNQSTWLPLASQKDTRLDPTSTTYTCCKEHAYTQSPSHMPGCPRPDICTSTFALQSLMAKQRFPTQAHYLQHTNGKCSRKSFQSSLHNMQRRREADSISQFHSACLAKKENCPPLPGSSAPPYVLCQGCDKILQVPSNLYNESAVQRIRCGACGRISRFCIVLHPYYRAILKKGIATGSTQRAYGSQFSNKHWPHSTAAILGNLSEQSSLYNAIQVTMPAKLDRSLGSSCVVGGQYDRVDKQMATQTKQMEDTSNYGEKLDAPCHRGPITTVLLKQGLCESEWRYGNSCRPLSSPGTVHEDYPSSAVCGYGPMTKAAGHWSHGLQQVESRVDSVSQSAVLEESKEALEAPIADELSEERIDTRVRVCSGEIQGLTLESLQESSSCGVSPPKNDMDSRKLQQGHGVSSDGVCPASCDVSPLKDHMDSGNLQQGHGQVGVSSNGVYVASCSPAPGSPLYEHLTYDTALEIVESACQSGNGAQQTGGEPYVQDASKGSNFLAGLLKKNIGKGGQKSNNWKLVVNGQIIPHAAIKSAEKLAGTIRPGVYWYDYEAGFWGVIGGPCLGIIPPFIAEFNVPLPKDCAGGTTEVYVNGRELHKKDLDALAGRGLPRTPGKAYMVDISGQVVDKASGQLLRSLGGLAPTIQRRGRGCGMFQPPTNS